MNAVVCAKESGSEKLISTIGELQKFHDTLTMNFLEYFTIQKNIQKLMKSVKLASDVKEEELSPSSKRAKAVAAMEWPSGTSLSKELLESRPQPLVLGGAHDHMLTSHMALATYGTMVGAASAVEYTISSDTLTRSGLVAQYIMASAISSATNGSKPA